MLSVFITPWQNPTACHCAITSAVRMATTLSSAKAGTGATRHSG